MKSPKERANIIFDRSIQLGCPNIRQTITEQIKEAMNDVFQVCKKVCESKVQSEFLSRSSLGRKTANEIYDRIWEIQKETLRNDV